MELFTDGAYSGGNPPRDGLNGAGSGLALVMDELAYGVLVTSLDNQVLHANQAARHELARRRVLGVRNQLLYGCTQEDGKALQEALTKVGQGKRSMVTLSTTDGFSLTMAVLPLKVDEAAGVVREPISTLRGFAQFGSLSTPDLPGTLTLPDGTSVAQMTNLASFAEQMLVHEHALVKINPEMPLDIASLIGPAPPEYAARLRL